MTTENDNTLICSDTKEFHFGFSIDDETQEHFFHIRYKDEVNIAFPAMFLLMMYEFYTKVRDDLVDSSQLLDITYPDADSEYMTTQEFGTSDYDLVEIEQDFPDMPSKKVH